VLDKYDLSPIILIVHPMQVLMMRRKQESGEGEDEPQPMVEDFAQNRSDSSTSGERQCLASTNPPAAIAQRQAAVTATPTAAQIAASKESAPGQPLSVDIPSKDSLPEHHIQVWISPFQCSRVCRLLSYWLQLSTSPLLCLQGKAQWSHRKLSLAVETSGSICTLDAVGKIELPMRMCSDQ